MNLLSFQTNNAPKYTFMIADTPTHGAMIVINICFSVCFHLHLFFIFNLKQLPILYENVSILAMILLECIWFVLVYHYVELYMNTSDDGTLVRMEE